MAHQDDPPESVYAARRERFNLILDAYGCCAGCWTVQFLGPTPTREQAMRTLPIERLRTDGPREHLAEIGRWALVKESSHGHGQFVESVIDRAELEQRAAESIEEGWRPVCYIDLDVLAGEEPHVKEGDLVEYDYGGEVGRYFVVGLEQAGADGLPYHDVYLHTAADGDTLEHWTHRADEAELTVIERAEPDPRMSARYSVAKTQTIVVFNTVADDAGC